MKIGFSLPHMGGIATPEPAKEEPTPEPAKEEPTPEPAKEESKTEEK